MWQEDGTEIQVYAMTQEQADKLWEAVTTCDKVLEQDDAIYNIVFEQAQAFYSGQKTAPEQGHHLRQRTALIQSLRCRKDGHRPSFLRRIKRTYIVRRICFSKRARIRRMCSVCRTLWD